MSIGGALVKHTDLLVCVVRDVVVVGFIVVMLVEKNLKNVS